MSGSVNSQTATSNEPTEPPNPAEQPADLSQNLDEINDVQLALAALGGLRATTANDAAERSHRRYDDRNHRWHEARTKERFGLESSEENKQSEGEASEGEVGHQVWVRSPVHNHYPSAPPPTAGKQGVSPLLAALAAAALTSGLVGAIGAGSLIAWNLLDNKRPVTPPAATNPDYSAGVTPGFGTPVDVTPVDVKP